MILIFFYVGRISRDEDHLRDNRYRYIKAVFVLDERLASCLTGCLLPWSARKGDTWSISGCGESRDLQCVEKMDGIV